MSTPDEQHPLGSGQASRWNASEENTFWAVHGDRRGDLFQYAVEPGTANRPIA